MSSLASNFDGVVQYNDDNRAWEHPGSSPPADMEAVCKTATTVPAAGGIEAASVNDHGRFFTHNFAQFRPPFFFVVDFVVICC